MNSKTTTMGKVQMNLNKTPLLQSLLVKATFLEGIPAKNTETGGMGTTITRLITVHMEVPVILEDGNIKVCMVADQLNVIMGSPTPIETTTLIDTEVML